MSDNLPMLAIPPRLVEAGVTMKESESGYRTLGFPPAVREAYNIILPTVELSQVNPDFHPIVREIAITAEDIYTGASHHKDGECSLNYIGLRKLMDAAKIELSSQPFESKFLGPTERCGYKATAIQRHSDGTITRFEASATFDNEAERGGIEAEVRSARAYVNNQRSDTPKFDTEEKVRLELDKRWRVKTRKASELTESLATERAIRGVLKLAHKMPKKEAIGKTWLVVCYALVPTTPEARHQAARAIAGMFGSVPDTPALPAGDAQALPPAPPGYQVDHETGELTTSHAAEDDLAGAAPPSGTGEASESDEPRIEEEGQQTIDGVVTHEDAVMTLEQALLVKPPTGSYQNFTLAEVIAKGDASKKWLIWALESDWSVKAPEFSEAIWVACDAKLPELSAEIRARRQLA